MSTNAPFSIVPENWPPRSVEAAEEEMLDLAADTDLIQAQLSDRNKTDEDGERVGGIAYHQWRSKALWALKKKTIRRRRLKAWIKAVNLEAFRIEAGVSKPTNAVELVGALLHALREAAGGEMTAREMALCSVSEAWIRSKGAPAIIAAREKVAS